MKTIKDIIDYIKGENIDDSDTARIIRKISELIKKANKKDIALNGIFSHYSKDNILQFQKILNILSDEMDENADGTTLGNLLNKLISETSHRLQNENIAIDENRMFFQINDIFTKLINFYNSGYFSVEKGEIKCLDLRLSPEDENFKTTIRSSLTKGCDGLIDKTGKFYFSYFEHEYMVQYLMAMSIDLTNALRVHQSHLNKEFALSSFCHYYSKGSNEVFKNDTNLALVKKQLETLKKILSLYHSDKEYILSVLKKSINLGFDFLSTSKYSGAENFDYKVATHNIMQLSKVFEDVDFSSFYDKILERAKYLHSANTIID